ncbi:MAG: MetS family NSS transporter small subunit [Candidatus Aminicenantes bacterium]|nr:MetS family NSS transporter small subunit [Candidatus Aminicenantes bacterium]
MKIEALIFMIIIIGVCLGGFIFSLYFSARENSPSKKQRK